MRAHPELYPYRWPDDVQPTPEKMAKAVSAAPLVHHLMERGRSYTDALKIVGAFLTGLERSLGIGESAVAATATAAGSEGGADSGGGSDADATANESAGGRGGSGSDDQGTTTATVERVEQQEQGREQVPVRHRAKTL
jgi:hypothetical protein